MSAFCNYVGAYIWQILCAVSLIILLCIVICDRNTSRSTSVREYIKAPPYQILCVLLLTVFCLIAAADCSITSQSMFDNDKTAVNAAAVIEELTKQRNNGNGELRKLNDGQWQIITDAFCKQAGKLTNQSILCSAVAVFIAKLPCLIFFLMLLLGGIRAYTVYRSTI